MRRTSIGAKGTDRQPNEHVVLTEKDHEVWVDASVPRIVTVRVLHKGAEQSARHLKITGKGSLTLM